MEAERENEPTRDSAKGLTEWAQERALPMALGVAFLFIELYPPRPGRYATYYVILPLLLGLGLVFTPSVRQAAAVSFGRWCWAARVAAASLMLPIVIYFVVAISLIPPAQPPPQTARAAEPATAMPKLTYMPTELIRPETSVQPMRAKMIAPKPREEVMARREVIEDEDAPQMERPELLPPAAPGPIRLIKGGQ